MRFFRYFLILPLVLLLAIASNSFAQQKRQQPKPPRRVTPTNASTTQVTFDTLLSADSYKIYGEVRGVGQLIRSNSVSDLLEPVMKLTNPPKEFKTLIKWLNTRADDVMTSRMLVATWPSAKNVPDAVFAIEFDSAEEATKFAPQLDSVLPRILPTPEPEPSSSTSAEEKNNPKPRENTPAKPSYYLKQVGSLILISPTPLILKNLRPAGSKLLTEDVSFRVARNRFSSEQLFVYVDIDGITKEEEENRKRNEEVEKNLIAAAATRAPENDASPESTPKEEEKNEPKEEDQFVPQATVSPVGELTVPQPQPDPLSAAIGGLANSFFVGQATWPVAIGFAVSFEADSFDVRALMVSAPGVRCDPIPFFPNLVPGPAFVPESPSILPADTELFAALSLDLPEIYTALSKPPAPSADDRSEIRTIKESEPVGPFEEIEKRLKIKVKDDLLPLLGSEIVVSMPVKYLEGAGPKSPIAVDQKSAKEPSFVIALSLKDKEGMRALIPKIVDTIGFKGASSLAQTEHREDTEMVTYGDMLSYAFIGDFLVISSDALTTRHVVDSYLKHETLSSDTQFKNYTRWQPRQLQAQVYVSPALMESYKSWVDQPGTLMSDQTREILSRLTLVTQPLTYSLSNDGLGTLHEVHIPKNLILMAVTGISAESDPSPLVANERATMSLMRMIGQAEIQYHTGQAGSFGTLEQLLAGGVLSEELMQSHGYKIEVTLIGSSFQATAIPLEYGKTGKRSYYLDETNILRGSDRSGGIATKEDPPIQ
ncbi:MAG TPA: DUF3352 domain-containing protein [Pyrinomonadaceae bacterium]|nr:DUF3352 domain-containing protein [Pyrinomonadaceae bacterium]